MKSFSKILLLVILFSCRAHAPLASEPNVSVTVYSNNLGQIQNMRSLELSRGTKEYRLAPVAAQIDPSSVQVRSLTAPGSVRLLEQRFEFDLAGTDRLLHKHLDQPILVTTRGEETFSGKLLSAYAGDVVLQQSDGSVRVVESQALDSIQISPLPAGFAKQPTLVWLLECSKPGKHKVETIYLTEGLLWNASYTARINEKQDQLEWSGTASVENRSGVSYTEAGIRLVAGDVNRASPQPIRRGGVMHAEAKMMATAAAPSFQESPLFEYHLYSLDRTVTLPDQGVTQIPLFAPATVKVEKDFTYDGERDQKRVRVNLVFENKKANGLGSPLPGGKVRAYKAGEDGTVAFVGEDEIKHSPEGEEVKLHLGSAFDLVGERTVLETRQVSKRSRQETVEIQLRNHKKEKVTITVIEHLRGNWKLVGDTPSIVKKEANKVEFEVTVPPKGEKVFQYKVLYTW